MSEQQQPPKEGEAKAPKAGPPKFASFRITKTREATQEEKTKVTASAAFTDATVAQPVASLFGPRREAPVAAPRQAVVRPAVPVVQQAPIQVQAGPALRPDEETALKTLEQFPKGTYLEKGDLQAIGKDIIHDDFGDPYVLNPSPPSFVPVSRRGFAESIQTLFKDFFLPPPADEIDFEACRKQGASGQKQFETYLYQKFVREYLRQETPYRGLLVYHGLGSGKTCSAIATAEALFSTARKKIIVMTPFSLRKNFIKEITSCGFQHFRLQNFWTPFPLTDPTIRLFATDVYGLPTNYTGGKGDKAVKNLWLPDFSKLNTPNFDRLTPQEQSEVRTQIYTVINNRITFINYNGISAKKLKAMACLPPNERPFDNSVIVIDEVHNLIRLMQGTIEPYLTNIPNLRRKIMPEPIKVGRWAPNLCGRDGLNYKRGYLFYRLLLDATNSKIVALSGTPLINFPEELGILANVLHGYIPYAQFTIAGTDDKVAKTIQELGTQHPFIDFIRVTTTPTSTQIFVTPLPYGTRKVPPGGDMKGVERMPPTEKIPTFQEIVDDFKGKLAQQRIPIAGDTIYNTEPLLPPFSQVFRDTFISSDFKLKNQDVLSKRLTGIISYYKGSKKEYMPEVTKDEIVHCMLSPYQQQEYIRVREEEVKAEEKEAKRSKGRLRTSRMEVWQSVFDIKGGRQATNYRMGSRQACNFVFPEEVTRPRTFNQKELDEEAGLDPDMLADADLEVSANQADREVVVGTEGDEEDAEQALEEDDEIEEQERRRERRARRLGAAVVDEDEPGTMVQTLSIPKKRQIFEILRTLFESIDLERIKQPKAEGETRTTFQIGITIPPEDLLLLNDEFDTIQFSPAGFTAEEGPDLLADLEKIKTKYLPRVQVARVIAPIARVQAEAGRKISLRELEAQRAKDLADCKAGYKQGVETYAAALDRSKRCLRQFAKKKMTLTSPAPDNLAKYSSKFAEMLKRIDSCPGSSLVYSQFLEMEGIGIFSVVMDLNGFVPIEIEKGDAGPVFSQKTLQSLQKGPSVKEYRYIKFTGGEEEEIRKYSLDIFNARFGELHKNLSEVLTKAGWTDNKLGQLCRVFCITSAGAEGLSLKNVRRVHIMEPYWNDVRLAQVKGRAVRICSHQDLDYNPDPAQNQRTVEIYTYVSRFSDDAMKAREGEQNHISFTIASKDAFNDEQLKLMGLRTPPGAEAYVYTSDEYLAFVSKAKKNILTSLETVMKSVAVDCRLNTYDNEDGTYRCFQILGKVGDFMYHPLLQQDLLESSVAFKENGGIARDGQAPAPLLEEAYQIEFEGRQLIAAQERDKTTGVVLRYKLYDAADRARTRQVGTMGADPSSGMPNGDATFT